MSKGILLLAALWGMMLALVAIGLAWWWFGWKAAVVVFIAMYASNSHAQYQRLREGQRL